MRLEQVSKKIGLRVLPARLLGEALAAYGSLKCRLSEDSCSRAARRVTELLGMDEDDPELNRIVRDLHRNGERWSISPAWKHAFNRYWRRMMPEEVRGEEHVREAAARGKGIIFLSSHIGAWRALPWFLSELGFSLDIAYPIRWPYNRKKGMSAISFLRQAQETLMRQGNVGMMADGHQGKNRTFVFLGREFPLATGFAYLAQRSSAPVVPLFLIRRRDGRYVAILSPAISADQFQGTVEAVSTAMTERYITCLEEIVRAHPCNAPAYFLGARLSRDDSG